MKTNNILCLISTIVLTLSCGKKGKDPEQGLMEWEKVIGGVQVDQATAAVRAGDGGYVIVGNSNSNNTGEITGSRGSTDAVVVKVDANGNRQWIKSYGGTDADEANAVAATPDGGFIVAGFTASRDGDVSGSRNSQDYWVMKIDANGTIQWSKTYGGWDNDVANAVIVTSDGGCVVAGYAWGNTGDISGNHSVVDDFWVLKLDASGNKQWAKCYGGSDVDRATSITACADGGFAITGTAVSNDGDITGSYRAIDVWVVKTDANGNITWNKRFGGSANDYVRSIKSTPEGGFIIAGYTGSMDGDVVGKRGSFGYDAWVIRLDASGTKQWAKTYGGTNDDVAYSILPTPDGGYVFGGYTTSEDGDVTKSTKVFGADCWLAKLNAGGDLVWNKCYGSDQRDECLSVISTDDNGYLLSGFTKDRFDENFFGLSDMWMMKIEP